jgi:hypothetical protein
VDGQLDAKVGAKVGVSESYQRVATPVGAGDGVSDIHNNCLLPPLCLPRPARVSPLDDARKATFYSYMMVQRENCQGLPSVAAGCFRIRGEGERVASEFVCGVGSPGDADVGENHAFQKNSEHVSMVTYLAL